MTRTTGFNSTFAIAGFSSSADSFVVTGSSVLRINICAENPAHRKSAKKLYAMITNNSTINNENTMNINLWFFVLLIVLLHIINTSSVFSQDDGTTHHHSPFPHPVNAAMGIPDPVGSYNIRLNGFRQQNDSTSEFDVSGHLGYGIFEWGGIHFRSLGVKTTPFTEVIGMVGLWRNKDRTQGISLLGIVGIPTGAKKKEQHNGLAYLFGFTGRIAKEDLLTNDVILHYDFSVAHFIVENGTVVKLSPVLFTTLDLRGTFGGSRPDISILPSIKWKIFDSGFIAFGFHAPLTKWTAFKNQIIIQIEIGSHKL